MSAEPAASPNAVSSPSNSSSVTTDTDEHDSVISSSEDIDTVPIVHVLGFYHKWQKADEIKIKNSQMKNRFKFNSQEFFFQFKLRNKSNIRNVRNIVLQAYIRYIRSFLATELTADSLVTVIMPSSDKDSPLNPELVWIAEQLGKELKIPFLKALKRTYTIEKATSGVPGTRSVSKRYDSLEVGVDKVDLQGKHVLVLDDVVTTGNSFIAALKRLRDANPDVLQHSTCLAVLQTCWEVDSHDQGACESNKKVHVKILDEKIANGHD